MKKTDNKLDKSLVEELTKVCDICLEKYDGFKWFTHIFVDFRFTT